MFTYSFISMSELIEKISLVKSELTDQEVLEYIINTEYLLDGIDPLDMQQEGAVNDEKRSVFKS